MNRTPNWDEAPEWANTYGYIDWYAHLGAPGEWCWFAGTHPSGVHHLVTRDGTKLPYVPLPMESL